MTFNVLISCMHQKDCGIIERSNVQSDVVVVNQCDKDSVEEFVFINKNGRKCRAKFICTKERGLSKSRNMAIRNAWGDICLICDDDEILSDDCEHIILKSYEENPTVGLIAFSLMRNDIKKTYPTKITKLGFKQILSTSSHQISFSRKMIGEKGTWFDEKMGSGTGNGGGEENKFMFDLKKKGVKSLYIPEVIATINPSPSQWFSGYDEKFFENQGWADRRLFGTFLGGIYLIYWAIFRRKVYAKDGVSVLQALKHSIIGFLSKR